MHYSIIQHLKNGLMHIDKLLQKCYNQLKFLDDKNLEIPASANILESIEHAYHLSLNEHSDYDITAPATHSDST